MDFALQSEIQLETLTWTQIFSRQPQQWEAPNFTEPVVQNTYIRGWSCPRTQLALSQTQHGTSSTYRSNCTSISGAMTKVRVQLRGCSSNGLVVQCSSRQWINDVVSQRNCRPVWPFFGESTPMTYQSITTGPRARACTSVSVSDRSIMGRMFQTNRRCCLRSWGSCS